jgi:hypothetical protein
MAEEGIPLADWYVNAAIHEASLGREEIARVHWESAKAMAGPNTYFLILARMGLGEKEAAIETAEQLVSELGPVGCRNTWRAGSRNCSLLARVYAHFGELDAAVSLLETLLPTPSYLTVHLLEIDPVWDPLRTHARFRALLEEYAEDVEH